MNDKKPIVTAHKDNQGCHQGLPLIEVKFANEEVNIIETALNIYEPTTSYDKIEVKKINRIRSKLNKAWEEWNIKW